MRLEYLDWLVPLILCLFYCSLFGLFYCLLSAVVVLVMLLNSAYKSNFGVYVSEDSCCLHCCLMVGGVLVSFQCTYVGYLYYN